MIITVGDIKLRRVRITSKPNAFVHLAERWITLCCRNAKFGKLARRSGEQCPECERQLLKLEGVSK